MVSCVILVEGRSDAAALHALDPTRVRRAGLCDVGEQRVFTRALERFRTFRAQPAKRGIPRPLADLLEFVS
jgi:hypothetical protein